MKQKTTLFVAVKTGMLDSSTETKLKLLNSNHKVRIELITGTNAPWAFITGGLAMLTNSKCSQGKVYIFEGDYSDKEITEAMINGHTVNILSKPTRTRVHHITRASRKIPSFASV